MLFSKIKWVEEGDKNTSYFLQLERRNYSNKVLSNLSVNGKLITDPKEILEPGKNYYTELLIYTRKALR